MPQKVRIALDAMGGDVGASVVVPGAAISLSRHPSTEFLLFGKRELIEPELARHPALKAACEAWAASCGDFNQRLAANEAGAVAEKGQRTYVHGRAGPEEGRPAYHLAKRRLKPPR